MPGLLVFDLQVDVQGAGALAFAHQWHHLAPGAAVECGQFALDLGKVRHLALAQGRHLLADLHGRVMPGADHSYPADPGFADLQVHHAAFDLLLGQLDEHRLIAQRLIAFLQGLAGAFQIHQGLLRAEVGVHRLLDGAGIEHRVAAHHVLVDIDATLGLFGACVVGSQGQQHHCAGSPPVEKQMLHTAPSFKEIRLAQGRVL